MAVEPTIIFIAGPTASGKSAAALKLCADLDGEIVNADAMQVYADLRILTARPSPEDQNAAPHHLYGFLDGAERCSAGKWSQMATQAIAEVHERGNAAIVVGGTGLYFRALEDGLSPIPDAPPEIREQAAVRRAALGPAAFKAEVVGRDLEMKRLPEGDAQRLMRAWEVFEATGKTLSYFQNLPRKPLIKAPAKKYVIAPAREDLYARCDKRASEMFAEGGVDEVRALLARDLDPGLPAMKALGVQEIAAFLRGEFEQDEALAMLQQNTRRYAKRQMTWFRNQAADWEIAQNAQDIETPTD